MPEATHPSRPLYPLHPVVRDIAKRLTLEGGRLVMTDADLARHKARILAIEPEGERRQVQASLVALGTRLMREKREGTEQAVQRLMALAAALAPR